MSLNNILIIMTNLYNINFESLNSNIIDKIVFIDKINLIVFNSIFVKLNNKNSKINNFEFQKNKNILINKYNDYEETKNYYKFKSTIYIVPYYVALNRKMSKIKQDNKYNYSNIDTIIKDECIKNDILELKQIFIDNNYNMKYNFYNNNNLLSNKSIDKELKNIYNKFKIFITSNNIYNLLDDYIYHINNFIKQLEENISELQLYSINSNLKNINTVINKYYKTKINDEVEEINYDFCSCGEKMTIQSNTSEFLCTKCGIINTLIGTVFEDYQFYNQEGSRYKHASYEPSRHCKFWIDRIQAKESTNIPENVILKLEDCIKIDRIQLLHNITIEQFRKYLKDVGLSKYNDHLPLIKKIITGSVPPQLDHNELQLLFNYFDKAVKTYNIIKDPAKNNNIYYPFLIWKILEIIISNKQKLKKLLNCIHLQGNATLIENDRVWKLICENHKEFIYKPTERL